MGMSETLKSSYADTNKASKKKKKKNCGVKSDPLVCRPDNDKKVKQVPMVFLHDNIMARISGNKKEPK